MAGQIALLYEKGQKVPQAAELSRLAKRVAVGEKLRGRVDIAFCSDEKVRALNKAYRKLDKVTDVLSFEWHEEDFAGEIFVANPQAKYQAPRFNNNYFNELRRLIVHGMLHLCGYDHLKTGERTVMRAKEDLYLGIASRPAARAPRKATVGATHGSPSKAAAKSTGSRITPKPRNLPLISPKNTKKSAKK